MIIRSFLILAIGLMAGCSGGTDKTVQKGSGIGSALTGAVKAKLARPTAPAANSAVTLTRAQLAGITDPLIRTQTEESGQKSLLYISQSNGSSQIWFSPDKKSFMMRAGLVTRTIGLGEDLYSVDAPAMLAVLERRGPVGPAKRVHRVMDGANAVTAETLDCVISDQGTENISVLERSFKTRHFSEACKGQKVSFTNDYWLDGTGIVRASDQWLGEEYGRLRLERLID